MGNIVRSPLAHNLFIHRAREAGVEDKYEIESAGTGAWHIGEAPDARMRRVASRYGLVYDGRARQFRPSDFERLDLIIAMDTENRDYLFSLARSRQDKEKIYLMRDFDPDAGANASVPDPYYGGIAGFEEVFHTVDRSVKGLLAKLEGEEHRQQEAK